MLRERFMCYIKGGTFSGNGYEEPGCKDPSDPIRDMNYRINRAMYFSKQSPRWSNMGVAFLSEKESPKAQAFGKMYLISRDQFEDVVRQENRIPMETDLGIDYGTLEARGAYLVFEDKFYGKLLCLGHESGWPIYTFTAPIQEEAYVKPSEAYLKSIMKGVLLNFGPIHQDLIQVFSSTQGVEGHYSQEDIEHLIKQI